MKLILQLFVYYNLDFCVTGDLDSTANSLQGSPLNDDEEDEETLDSDEIIGAKSSFISTKQKNGTTDSLRLDKLLELSSPKLEFFEKEDGKEDDEPESVNDNHNFDNKSINTKRLKEVNAKNNCGADCMSSGSDAECDGTLDKCSVKRMRLDSHEKNFRRENQTESQCLRMSAPIENGALASHEETEADKHWVKHLRSNRSVIVDTFQGQFKSTVITFWFHNLKWRLLFQLLDYSKSQLWYLLDQKDNDNSFLNYSRKNSRLNSLLHNFKIIQFQTSLREKRTILYCNFQ